MVTDEDYNVLVRDFMLLFIDVFAELGTLRLAVQKYGVTPGELAEFRSQIERSGSLEQVRKMARESASKDLLSALKGFSGTIQ